MDKELGKFAERLNELLPYLMREFTRRQVNELSKGKITVPQMVILEFLSKKNECIMSDLADYLVITTSAVTGLIDRMIEAGLVNRERDKNDRRLVKIKLTQKGTDVIGKIITQREKMLMDIFGNISHKEREIYLQILEKVCPTLTK